LHNFRTALGFAFFAALVWPVLSQAQGWERFVEAAAVGGIVGFGALLVLTIVDYRDYGEPEEEAPPKKSGKDYELSLQVYEGNTVYRGRLSFDNVQLRTLFRDLASGRGAHAETRRGRYPEYKRVELEANLKELERMGLVTRSQNYNNGKWEATERGVLFARELANPTTPLPGKDALIVRLPRERT